MSLIRVVILNLALYLLTLQTCQCILAKKKFCRQKYFDSVSFDGERYRFTVNRRDITKGRYTFELFELRYDASSDSFEYNNAIVDSGNLLPLGGFYLKQLGVYFEFCNNTNFKQLLYCNQPCSQNAQCHSLDSRNDPSQYSRFIINTEAIQLLKNGRKCAFAYDQGLERILYIFSDSDSSPVVINSLRTVSSRGSVPWFTKSIEGHKMTRFVGAFNWPTGVNSSSLFLLAQTHWKRTNLILFELSEIGKFSLVRKKVSWQSFFGCDHQISHSQHQLWQSTDSEGRTARKTEKNRGVLNVFTVSILLLLTLCIALAAVVFVRNVKFGTFKMFFKTYQNRFEHDETTEH